MARTALLIILLVGFNPAAVAESGPDAAEIMARVAANQDRAVEQRREFVYRQKARVRLLKTNGKLLWDETREYDVTPTADGTEFELTRRYGHNRKSSEFDSFRLPDEDGGGLDSSLVEEFHEGLRTENGSRDGLKPHFFPLTSDEQRRYRFTLAGEEEYRGRGVYRVRFEPPGKRSLFAEENGHDPPLWEGEVLVDKEEFQPVFVATQMALKIPLAFRLLFGIGIRQIGFSVSYQRFAEGVWFPVSYGGEFRLKLLHFYKRTVIVSTVNQDFRRASVASDIQFAQPVEP